MCDYRVLLVNSSDECFVIDKGLKFFSKEETKSKNRFIIYSSYTKIYKKIYNLVIRVIMNIECQKWLKVNNTDLSVYVLNKKSKKWCGYASTNIKRKGLSKTTTWTVEDVMLNYEEEISMTEDLIESLDGFVKQVLRNSTLDELL